MPKIQQKRQGAPRITKGLIPSDKVLLGFGHWPSLLGKSNHQTADSRPSETSLQLPWHTTRSAVMQLSGTWMDMMGTVAREYPSDGFAVFHPYVTNQKKILAPKGESLLTKQHVHNFYTSVGSTYKNTSLEVPFSKHLALLGLYCSWGSHIIHPKQCACQTWL